MKSVITEDELTGLIQENRREMYYFAMSMIANPTEAQDVVGEAIMRAFEHRHQLRKKDSAKVADADCCERSQENPARQKKNCFIRCDGTGTIQ